MTNTWARSSRGSIRNYTDCFKPRSSHSHRSFFDQIPIGRAPLYKYKNSIRQVVDGVLFWQTIVEPAAPEFDAPSSAFYF
jgi:hypothetical protein